MGPPPPSRSLGPRPDVPGRRVQPGRATPAAPGQSGFPGSRKQVRPCERRHPWQTRRWCNWRSTRSAPLRWTRCSRPTPAIPARRWRWRRWPTACGSASCASTLTTRSGPTATGSCSRSGTPRCCCTAMLHLTGVKAVNPKYEALGRAVGAAGRHQAFPAARQQMPRPSRNTAGPPASRRPPARSGKGVATSVGMAIAARWLASYFNRPGFELFDYDVYALCGDGCMMEGHLRRGRVAGRAPQARQPVLDLRQQPHHHRGQHGLGLQRRRGHAIHRLRLERDARGRRQRSGDARARLHDVQEHDGPADPDHRRQPHRLRRAQQAGHQRGARRAAGRGGDPAGQAALRLAGRRQVPRARRRARAFPGRHRQARAGAARRPGWPSSTSTASSIPNSPSTATACCAASCPTAGTRTCRRSPPTPRGSPAAMPRARCSTCSPRTCRGCSAARRISARRCKTRLTFEGAGDFSAENPAGRNLHFGIREHAMGAILNGLSLSKMRPFGSGFLIFSDYGRAAIRLSALMEIPVIHIFTHDSIGVGEDGPTHQPVEQLASLRAIPGLITLRPGGCQRGRRGVAGDHAVAPRAGGADPDPPGAADPGPHQVRLGRGRPAGRVCAGRGAGAASPTCCCWPPAAKSRCASRRTSS